MPRQFKPSRRDLNLDRMFETRSDAWERVGLSIDVDSRDVQRSRRRAIVLIPLLIALIVAYDYVNHNRWHVLRSSGATGLEAPITIVTVLAVMVIGWALARAVGTAAGPTFMRRLDPATAGTVGFLIRLLTMAVALVAALSVAGVTSQTLAVGGAFTAVIFGLAAQQTLGNVFAGMVLLSARSFRVGDRVRLQAGAIGIQEGIVSSLGLLYTKLTSGADQIMIPNNQVLAAVVVPLTEPDSVDVKVRLTSGVRPSQVQAILNQEVSVPTRTGASVNLEEVDGDDVVVRVKATPEMSHDGARLADEIMGALQSVTGEHETTGSNNRG
ncbi:MAG TPA: mechanosensitive ion channel family protein [Solirubrobacteraceae bacterium]|jgi:small-conductance mechanosensitive channel|nr:mechanosensitive ion channel family protein [Solirubrobacteraceae bacterium]